MPTTHTQNKSVRVSGHLEEKRGIYQMILSWYSLGKRGRKSLSTGLKIKGNKKRAEEMLRLAIQEKEAEIATSPITGDILFADFMEQWLEMRRKDVAKKKLKLTTFSGYQMSVNSAIAPYFRKQGILLRDLTAEDINEFYDVQLERVKATTVHRYHANISHALQYAVKCGLIPHSMIDMVERPKAEKFKAGFLKQSEVVALFDAVRGDKLELGVILGAYYGLRRSEVVGLRWESINFESNTITIEHTVTATTVDGKRIVIAEDTTKTKSSLRTLPLVPAFRQKLLEIKAEQEYYRKLCGNGYNKEDAAYVYVNQLGKRIRPDYLTTGFPEFLERNGFRRIRYHDLRHSCASLLLANGVPLKNIQEWLGHSDFSITANIYAHLEVESKRSSAEAMTWLNKTQLADGIIRESVSIQG